MCEFNFIFTTLIAGVDVMSNVCPLFVLMRIKLRIVITCVIIISTPPSHIVLFYYNKRENSFLPPVHRNKCMWLCYTITYSFSWYFTTKITQPIFTTNVTCVTTFQPLSDFSFIITPLFIPRKKTTATTTNKMCAKCLIVQLLLSMRFFNMQVYIFTCCIVHGFSILVFLVCILMYAIRIIGTYKTSYKHFYHTKPFNTLQVTTKCFLVLTGKI